MALVRGVIRVAALARVLVWAMVLARKTVRVAALAKDIVHTR